MLIFLSICLMITLMNEKTFGKMKRLNIFLLVVVTSLIVIHTKGKISSIDILFITILFYNIFARNIIKSLLISFRLLSYFFVAFFSILLLSIFFKEINSFYAYSISFIILSSLDAIFHFTKKAFIRYNDYLELIIATYLFLSLIITFELRESFVFSDPIVVLISCLSIFVFIYLTTQVIELTAYYTHNENLKQLVEIHKGEYHNLLLKQEQALLTIQQSSDDDTYNQLKHYFKEHQVPVYSNDEAINFIMYYVLDNQKGYINTEHVQLEQLNLVCYYLLVIAREITQDFSVATTPLEKNLIILQFDKKNNFKRLEQVFIKFKHNDTTITKWYLSALKFLFEQNSIKTTFEITDKYQIQFRW